MKLKSAAPIILILLLCAAGAYILYLHNKPVPGINYLNFYLGKVEVINTDSAVKPARIKMPLHLSDRIKTYDKSKAWIQCGADNLIEVDELSELSMKSLPGALESAGEKTELQLLSGRIKAFTAKLTKKGEFSVRAGTRTASVRGTLFSVELKGTALTVLVYEGAVAVSSAGASGEITVKTGQRGLFTDDGEKLDPMSAADRELFNIMLKLDPMPGIPCTPAKYIENYYRKILNLHGDSPAEKEKIPDKEISDEAAAPPEGGVRLGVATIKGAGVGQEEVLDITTQLYQGLVTAKGDSLVMRQGIKNKYINRLLSGRMTSLGVTRILVVSVADVQSGKVIISRTLTLKKGDDVPARLGTLILDISKSDAVWKL